MQRMSFDFPAGAPAPGRVVVGVVGSGDLEVLMEPAGGARTRVDVTTSVDGFEALWRNQLERVFGGALIGPQAPAVRIEINDFGATPGVVGMRLAEAFRALDTLASDGPGTPAGTSPAEGAR